MTPLGWLGRKTSTQTKTSHLYASYQVLSQLAFQFRRREKQISNQDNFSYCWSMYKSPQSFLSRSKSIGLTVQEKKSKINFNMATMVAILDFRSEWFYFFFFTYKTLWCFLPKLKSIGLSVQKKWKTAILHFWLELFYLFLIYKSPWWLLQSFKSMGHSVQEKQPKTVFQDGCHCGHLGFPIWTILAIFDLQVTPMLPSKFPVNWPFGSVKQTKKKRNDLASYFFYLQVTLMLPT